MTASSIYCRANRHDLCEDGCTCSCHRIMAPVIAPLAKVADRLRRVATAAQAAEAARAQAAARQRSYVSRRQRVWDLRIRERRSVGSIARKLGMPESAVERLLREPEGVA